MSVIAMVEAQTNKSLLSEALTPAALLAVIQPSAESRLALHWILTTAAGLSPRGPSNNSKSSPEASVRMVGDDASNVSLKTAAFPVDDMYGFSVGFKNGV